MDNLPPEYAHMLGQNMGQELTETLQPADIGIYLDAAIDKVVERIREGCDHGCSLAFLALLLQGLEDRFEAELDLVPADTVSPEIHALINEVLGVEDEG